MCVCVLNLIFFFFESCKKHLLFHPPLLNTLLKGLLLSASGVRGLERPCRLEIYCSFREPQRHTGSAQGQKHVLLLFYFGDRHSDTLNAFPSTPITTAPALACVLLLQAAASCLLARPPHWLDSPAPSNLSSAPATPGMTFLEPLI